MKDIYMIWEENFGNTTIFFEKKEDAEIFCQLKNEKYSHNIYSYKEMTFYNNFEDYKKNDSKMYKYYLKEAIKGLTQKIKEIENDKSSYFIELKDEFHISCYKSTFEDILKKGKYENYTATYWTFSDFRPDEYRGLTKEDLPEIKKGYTEAKKHFDDMKKRLENYKREYVELVGKDKEEKQEELELKK